MDTQNQIRKPLLIIFLVTVIFSALSFLPTEFHYVFRSSDGDSSQIDLKKVDFFSDLTDDRIDEKKNENLTKPYADFIDKDSLSFKKGFYRIENFQPAKQDVLKNIFTPLLQLIKTKKGNIRVAWFGDSLVEGDILTQDIRDILQRKFGGVGVGFVPITNNVPHFRQSIGQDFSNNWKVFSLLDKSTVDKQIAAQGIAEEVFVPAYSGDSTQVDTSGNVIQYAPSWVSFYGVKQQQIGLDKFYSVKLFYSHVNSAASVLVTKDGKTQTLKLESGNALHVLVLNEKTAIQKIKISFHASSEIFVYGVSFEKDNGVFVDDFTLRGASGMQLSMMNSSMMNQYQNEMGYDLIVLHYGLNIANEKQKDYSAYQKQMETTIDHLKQCFPGAEIMVVSCSDRSKNVKNGTMKNLPEFVAMQEKLAEAEKISFWNLFEAMGGSGSMITMVNSKEPLANKDYTHFKSLGGKYLAQYFCNAFIYEFNYFVWNKNKN